MQTLVKIWTFIRKYAGLLIAGLFGILIMVTVGRKSPVPSMPPADVDNNGKDDEKEIQVIKKEAEQYRKEVETRAKAAEAAVARPIQPKPSKSVRDAVQRNNEVDY